MRYFVLLVMSLLIVGGVRSQNSEIIDIISHINEDSIRKNVEDLENFTTRFAFADNNRDVALYLKDRMEYYGFEVVLDSFYESNSPVWRDSLYFDGWQYNVCCLKQSLNPLYYDTSLILGAHYDCISNIDGFDDYIHFAPGADDNASGVACLLELARVWDKYSKRQDINLRIEFFANEEQMLSGSNARLHSISSPWQMYIVGMINLDMVGYDTTNTVALNYYNGCDWLTDIAKQNITANTDMTYRLTQKSIENSDSWCFYSWGIPSLFISESDFSPYYHTLQDSSVYLNYTYMKKITSLTLSMVYYIVNNISKVSLNKLKAQDCLIYVNKNKVFVDLYTSLYSRVRITDILGNVVFYEEYDSPSFMIPIDNLNEGFYILELVTPYYRTSKKIRR